MNIRAISCMCLYTGMYHLLYSHSFESHPLRFPCVFQNQVVLTSATVVAPFLRRRLASVVPSSSVDPSLVATTELGVSKSVGIVWIDVLMILDSSLMILMMKTDEIDEMLCGGGEIMLSCL